MNKETYDALWGVRESLSPAVREVIDAAHNESLSLLERAVAFDKITEILSSWDLRDVYPGLATLFPRRQTFELDNNVASILYEAEHAAEVDAELQAEAEAEADEATP